MKLEHQFTTIEQSKKLVELGIDANLAKFWHVELEHMIKNKENDEITYKKELRICSVLDRGYLLGTHIAPAFSMAEVLKMLEMNGVSTHTPLNTHKQADYLINRLDNRWIRIDVNEVNKALQD